MQTHEDRDFDWDRLKERARNAMTAGASTITAGAPGEKPIRQWDVNGMTCIKMPADEQCILRVSLGGGVPKIEINYCVYRGGRDACISLLEEALEAMKLGGGE